MAEEYSTVYMHHIFFIHLSVNGHFDEWMNTTNKYIDAENKFMVVSWARHGCTGEKGEGNKQYKLKHKNSHGEVKVQHREYSQ